MSAGIATIGRLEPRIYLLLLASACGSEPEVTQPRGLPPIAQPERPLASQRPGLLGEPTPAALLESTRARLRLTPDGRFLAALSRLDGFAGDTRSAPPTVRFDAGRWQLRIGQYDVGVLPELPGFADQYAMLLARATRLWTQHGKELPRLAEPDAGAPMIAADPPLPTLQRIEASWSKGERSREDARSAAQAYAVLSLGMPDELGLADAFFAQALAATAFAEAVSGQPLTREKALLAWTMGYAQSALAIAAPLPAEDAVRRFLAGEVEALVATARDASAAEIAGLLALRAWGVRPARELEAFLARAPEAVKTSFPALAAAASRSPGPEGEWRMAFGALIALREQVGREVKLPAELGDPAGGLRAGAEPAQIAAALGVSFEQVLAEGEQLLDALAAKTGGAWLPVDALVAYHRARLFSALDGLVRFQLASLDSPEQAKDVVAMLGAGKGPLAAQFARYAKDIARADQRSLPLDELVKDIRELKDLGVGALERLWEPLHEQGGSGSARQQAASAISERCDTRIRCRALLTTIADRDLQDPVTDEKLRSSVIAEAPLQYAGLRLRHLRLERDRSGFLAATAERSVPVALRAEYLGQAAQWLEPAELEGAFAALLGQAPASFAAREAYAKWLIEQKDYARAIKTLDEWIRQKQSDQPLDPIAAHTLRARALQQWGRVAEAWTELEPQLSSMYAGALMRGAYVRLAAGKHKEAVALAQGCLARYPNPVSVGLLAELLWKTGQHAEAAALIEQWSSRLTPLDWSSTLASAFAAAFADQPAEQGSKAYAELLAKKVDAQGARLLLRAGKLPAELAFRAYSQVKATGSERLLDVATGYVMLRDWKGESEARTWLEQALPADQRDGFSQHAYTASAYDLIWNLVADPRPDQPEAGSIWLMRTAAFLRSEAPPETWKQRIDQHYAKHREQLRDRMGLHLLGQIDQAGVWEAIKDDHDRAGCTYVFGLKAQLDGDIAQAIEWYRITVEGGRNNSSEVQWASDALALLRASDKSIALLTAEAKAKQPAAAAAAAPAAAVKVD